LYSEIYLKIRLETPLLLVTMICGFWPRLGGDAWPQHQKKGKIMRTTVRSALLVTAFAVTIAGELTGASFGGEVRDVDPAVICAEVAWPWIPSVCLEGNSTNQVRYVTADRAINARKIDLRFAAAFE
jgi:hypothetical protein